MTGVIVAKDQLTIRVLIMVGIHHLLYLLIHFVKKFGEVQNRTIHKNNCTSEVALGAWTHFTVHARAKGS